MYTCHHIERAQAASANQQANVVAPVDTVTLDETDRRRRRLLMTSDAGIDFLLELESVTLLKHNDILRLNDGRGIRVQAKPEALYEIHGSDRQHLLTLTWHVGNRHIASEIREDHVRIRHDPVIRNMLEHLGAKVCEVQAGFNPEGGAYGDTHAHHAHDHG